MSRTSLAPVVLALNEVRSVAVLMMVEGATVIDKFFNFLSTT
jgi:hypothetical protein